MNNFTKLSRYYWNYIKDYKTAFFANFILFGVMIAITDIVTPIYIKNLTNALASSQVDSAQGILITILILWVIGRVFLFSSMHLLSWFEIQVAKKIYTKSFKDFIKHEYHYYANNFTGSLVEKSIRLGQNFIQLLDSVIFQLFSLSIAVIGSIIILFNQHPYIGYAFIVFLVLYCALTFWANKRLGPLYEERSKVRTRFRGTVSDIISNIQTVLFFGNRSHDIERFQEKNVESNDTVLKAWRASINYEQGISMLAPFFTIAVTFYSIILFTNGLLSVGAVILVFSLANSVNSQIWRLGGISRGLISSIGDTIEAIEVVERTPEVQDSEDAVPVAFTQGAVVFDNVSFAYPAGEHVFNAFNMNIEPGQRIGIVGKSGSGKTSLTKLLLRLYNLNEGSILIDGQDIVTVKQDEFRKYLAYIPQDTVLFHRSIFDNIHYADLSKSKEEVIEAARLAYVDEFVNDLEEGYDTMVGERGIKLSGGQRQRVGIARAMLKSSAPVLIMDEATSALDSKSEHLIQESFEALSKGRTTFVIAHRLSTIQKMDRILVMEKGVIIEDGSHEELIAKKGYYADLWKSQVNGFID